MRRREFIRTGVFGGVTLAAGTCAADAAGRVPSLASQPTADPSRAFEHDETTVVDLQRRMAAGSLTSEGLCAAYLARIEAIDRSGPRLGSVIETNPEALAIARALDAERRDTGARGPLHGVPVLLKDNIDTGDRMMTSAGFCPSNNCGLVGLKPTVGLVSRSGIVPISASQDTAGPMTRTVADAAVLLSAMTGIDSRDPATAASRGRTRGDYTTALDAGASKGARMAWRVASSPGIR